MSQRITRIVRIVMCLSFVFVSCGGDAATPIDAGGNEPSAEEEDMSDESGAVFEESVTLTAGAATVAIDGEKKDQGFEMPFLPDDSTFEDGRVSLSWQDKDANSLNILGPASTGSSETSIGEMTVQVVTLNGDYLNSTEGECTVEMEQANADGVSGTFLCEGVQFGDGTVDIQGAFAAEP